MAGSMTDPRLSAVLSAIDAVNASDPNRVRIGGKEHAAEAIYAERMTAMLERLCPNPSPHLRIAARGQHIERWILPRTSHPMNREGYLRWRTALKAHHADRVASLMAVAGYTSDDIERVRALVLKRALRKDAEAQTLEDTVCVVFLEDYFADFAVKHDAEKVVGILRKTWAKMSPLGRKAALALSLPAGARELIDRALANA